MGMVKKSSPTPGSLFVVSMQWDLARLGVLGGPGVRPGFADDLLSYPRGGVACLLLASMARSAQ